MSLEERFVRAVAFCLRRDGYDGERAEALARWALSLEDGDVGVEERRLKVALVSGGATRIKAYVFESARLPEIRGASALLDRVNLEDVPRLWSAGEDEGGVGCEECVVYANGGEVLAFAPVGKAEWLADEIERLYARETMVAQSVAVWQAFELGQLRDGLLTGADFDREAARRLMGYVPAGEASFGSLVVPLALAKFRRREGNAEGGREPRSLAHVEAVPFARRCSSCERRAAVVNARVGEGEENDRPLCEPCARKRVFGQLAKREGADLSWWNESGLRWQPRAAGRTRDRDFAGANGPSGESQPRGADVKSWETRFEDWVEAREELKSRYAVGAKGARLASARIPRAVRDLGEIAQASEPQGYIGVVYADGNEMGRLLERLDTPSTYRRFAESVYRATQDATFAALATSLRPAEVKREGSPDGVLVHPFEVLSIGGDDLLLIVPAHVALPIACDIAEDVERSLPNADPMFRREESYAWEDVQRCRGGVEADAQCKVSLSAGVVIADAHTPIFYLQELVTQLLKSAKARARWLAQNHNYFGGTIDFLSLKSVTALSGRVEDFRDQAMTVDGRRLYARPYTLAEARALIETVKALMAAGLPRGQLYRLRDSLKSGLLPSTVDYRYFLSRDANINAARLKIEEMWTRVGAQRPQHPWLERPDSKGDLETIWPDVAELYDFVPQEETDARGQD